MTTNLYVGNLAFDTDSNQLEQLFAQHGSVSKAQVITDRESGRSRGFGFVEMAPEDAKTAIQALDGHQLNGRQITVNEAKPRQR